MNTAVIIDNWGAAVIGISKIAVLLYSCNSKVCGGACRFTPIHSLTGPESQPFASHLGDRGLHPRDAPKLTMEPGSPASDVSLHW
jgi:hypothetical protein